MSTSKPNYKVAVFSSWMNITGLAAFTLLSVVGDSFGLFLFGLAVEGACLWILPDIPWVQRLLDNGVRIKKIEEQRRYYARVLYNFRPENNVLFSGPVDWTNFHGPFGHLCQIVQDLRRFQEGQPEAISDDVLIRIEEMINGYLSLRYAVQTARQNLKAVNRDSLGEEFIRLQQTVKDSDPNDKAIRVVLAERLRSIKVKVDSIPRIERRISLAEAQSENVIQSIEALAIQIKTQGSIDLGASIIDSGFLLDVDQNQVDLLEVATEVRGMSSPLSLEMDINNQDVWASLASSLGTKNLLK